MVHLFVDMDGTLAEFRTDASFKDLYEEGYFFNLRPHENVIEGLKIFKENNPDVVISVLSCVLEDRPKAAEEKVEWLKKYCPFLMNSMYFVPCGTDKSVFTGKRGENFLLDDHSPNLLKFENGGNNHGIKLLNGINGQGIKWHGKTIQSDLDAKRFAKELETIINGTVSFAKTLENFIRH